MRHFFLVLFLTLCAYEGIAQTFPRRTRPYERTNEADNINYEEIVQYQPCREAEFIRSDLAFQGYDEGQPSQGIGEVTYYYRNDNLPPAQRCPDVATNPKVSKPVVVLDGFDPRDTRAGAEVYGKYLRYLQSGTEVKFLGDDLRRQGYDVVILNFPRYEVGVRGGVTITPVQGQPPITIGGIPAIRDGGADYIERNAFVLIKLIQNLNQELRSQNLSEKITLVGPSMGGLISRYALAYMEKRLAENPTDPQWRQQWDANVKLWVSFDSPHLGANIPIGDQWMVNYLAGVSGSAKRARDQRLSSTAAKQLLLHHFTSGSTAVAGDPGFRERFVSNLTTNGVPNSAGQLTGFPNPDNDPAKVRKVALVNGSQNADLLPGAACGQAIRVEINKTLGFRLFLFAITLSVTKRLIDATAYFSPSNSGSCKVFEGKSGYVANIPMPGRTRFANAYNSGTGIDLAPGGKLDIQNVIAQNALDTDKGLAGAFINVVVSNPTPDHVFIPVKSSLGYNWKVANGMGDLGEGLNTRNLVCEGIIPFDTYYAPVQNEDHVSLSAQSADWIVREINGLPQKPVLAGAFPVTVTGQLTCADPNSTITASVPSQEAGSTYTWAVSAGLTIVSGQNTSQVVLRSAAPSNSTETVNVDIGTSCSLLKPVQAAVIKNTNGYGSGDYPVSGPDQAVCGTTAFYSTVSLPGATNYQWVNIPMGATNVSGQGTRFLSFTVPTGISFMNVGVRVASACDAGGSPATKNTVVTCPGGRRSVEVYPNPADFELTVAQTEIILTGPAQGDGTLSVRLYDALGRRVAQGQTKGGKVTLAVGHLPTGVYLVQGKDGSGQAFTQRVALRR